MIFGYELVAAADGGYVLVPSMHKPLSKASGEDKVTLDASGVPTELVRFNNEHSCMPDERVSGWLRRWPGDLQAEHSHCTSTWGGGSLCHYVISRKNEEKET